MAESMIGAGPKRIEGRLKVTGLAPYTADYRLPEMAYAYGVFSTIASGVVVSIDKREALAMPGVIDIFHHGHFPSLYRSPSSFAQHNRVEETRTPFEDDRIYYAGQFVALVVAETFEQARAAAFRVKVDYRPDDETIANVSQGLAASDPSPGSGGHSRGDAASAYARSAVQLDQIYTTPVETHNPMEMHATLAHWQQGRLIVQEATQGVVQHRGALAAMLGIPPSRVEVRAPYIGSGFGGKAWAWPHSVAASVAAREVGRPVQLLVPRAQMFTTTGHRAETRQHLRFSATEDGRMTSMRHDTVSGVSFTDAYLEQCGRITKLLYGCADVSVSHASIPTHRGTPTSMRAPGATPGSFALESAIDELAEKVGMDPVEFRLRNYAEHDDSVGLPFSSNHIAEATRRAAERFGWDDRNPAIGAMREGHEIIGYGVAACNWEAQSLSCKAQVSLRADGTALASCSSQDIGTGAYTIIAQVVADMTGLPLERIEVRLADTTYPQGVISGGSWTTAATLPAVADATRKAIEQVKQYANQNEGALNGVSVDEMTFEAGQVKAGSDAVTYTDVLAAARLASANGDGSSSGALSDEFSFHSYGAHFVEVRWDPGISRLRIARVVTAIDAGKIINSTTARAQVEGAIVMGLGMANFEATEYDERNAMPINNDFAEYLVPVHADHPPEMDVILLDYPDMNFNEFGARGIGEIGITGIAAAVANAVHHATGKRIRELPITLDKLIEEV